MSDIWEDLGDWVDKVGAAACAAVDEVGTLALGWLDEALAGRTPEEVGELLLELDRVPFLAAWSREARERLDVKAAEGDVIGVQRVGYTHYGVYASDDEVLHYRSAHSEVGDDARVISTSLAGFLGDAEAYFVLDVHERARSTREFVEGVQPEVTVFPPAVVVARARARLGEGRYHLVWQNCEHFALWCKTGEAVSAQVGDVVSGLATLAMWLEQGEGGPCPRS